MESIPTRADVVVVGGGVIGASIAYHLAERGISVCLIEAKGLAAETSGNCLGGLLTQTKKAGPQLALALESVTYTRELASVLPIDMELHEGGSLVIATDESQLPVLENLMRDRGKEAGLEWLTGDEARKREPAFSNEVIAATYCSRDATVNPHKLAMAFAAGAKRAGAEILQWTVVTDFLVSGNDVVGVRTTRGDIGASQVVLAAGVLSRALGEKLALRIPVEPCRGQLVVTEPLPRILRSMILGADYLALKHRAEAVPVEVAVRPSSLWGDKPITGVVIYCTQDGNVLLGGTYDMLGCLDRSTAPAAIQALVSGAVAVVPRLQKARCIRSFAGLRPVTPDGQPIVGRMADHKEVYVVTGHSGDGIALAGMTGKLVADDLLGHGYPDLLRSFTPDRFVARQAAV
jgi:glycine/D-amino acid oxidase-like deaminating enzyme